MASKNIIKGPRDSFNKVGSVKFAKRNKKVSSSSSVVVGVGGVVTTSSGDGVDSRSSQGGGAGKSGHGTMKKPSHEGQEDKPGTPTTAPPVPKPRTLLPDGGKLHTIKESPTTPPSLSSPTTPSSLSSPTTPSSLSSPTTPSSLSSPTTPSSLSSSSSTLVEGTKTRHRLDLKLDLKPVYENASHLSDTRQKTNHQAVIPDVVSMTHADGKSHKKKSGNASSKNAEHGKPKFKINKHTRQQQQQQPSSPGIDTHKHLQNSVIKDTGEEFTTRKNETSLLMSSDAEWPTLQSSHRVKVGANKAKAGNPCVPEKSTSTAVPNPQKSSSVKVSGGVVSDKNMMKRMGAYVPEKSTIITKTDPHTREKSVHSSSNRTHTPRSTASTNPLHAELISKYSSRGGGGGGGGKVSRLHKVKTKEPKSVQELFSGYKFNVYGDRLMDASGSDRLKMEQTTVLQDDSFSLYTSTDNNKENKHITKHGESTVKGTGTSTIDGEKSATGKDPVPDKPERHIKKQLVSQEAPEPHKRIKKSVNFTVEPSLSQGLPTPPGGASGDGSKTPDQDLRSHHGSVKVPRKASGDDANSFNRGLASYTPSKIQIGSTFELGVSRTHPPPQAPPPAPPAPMEVTEEEYLRPADDNETVTWSAESTSDMLF
ncbi:hypothetical protein Pmani_026262 [Petrolisthes manimaculis]|uniref:Uncharacterized protein n=1 Tax=Petrolisthes manimaculis TaxID=1843537 RepID=A0AAE1U095_9EUCA|nr:hypothetical protein Pmani_026262 [Petrolisthes manimaculis]